MYDTRLMFFLLGIGGFVSIPLINYYRVKNKSKTPSVPHSRKVRFADTITEFNYVSFFLKL